MSGRQSFNHLIPNLSDADLVVLARIGRRLLKSSSEDFRGRLKELIDGEVMGRLTLGDEPLINRIKTKPVLGPPIRHCFQILSGLNPFALLESRLRTRLSDPIAVDPFVRSSCLSFEGGVVPTEVVFLEHELLCGMSEVDIEETEKLSPLPALHTLYLLSSEIEKTLRGEKSSFLTKGRWRRIVASSLIISVGWNDYRQEWNLTHGRMKLPKGSMVASGMVTSNSST